MPRHDSPRIVPPELAGPLDRAVRGLFGVSWGQARAWIEHGKVKVGDSVASEPTARAAPGVAIALDIEAPRPRAGRLTDEAVIFADAHIVVVAKPAGVSSVPYAGDEKGTLDARVRDWLTAKGLSRRAGGRPNLGIVHRLDKETTGLLVFTRTWIAKKSLTEQFRRHSVERIYQAIAHGDVRSRTIRSILVADRGDGLRGSSRGRAPSLAAAEGTGTGREAVTHVHRLEALAGATLVECHLETGRTHQIRIHLAEAGHPLVGEAVYARDFRGVTIPAPRVMLHACALGFVHPATGRAVSWRLPMPGDMREVMETLRRP